MTVSSAGSLANRVAKQLGIVPARLDGTGPDGSTTLNDVLRQAGRAPPSAARPTPPRAAYRRGNEPEPGVERLAVACDSMPIRAAREALAALGVEPPEVVEIVVRLCGAALRDFPELAGVTAGDEDSSRPGAFRIMVRGPVRAVPIWGADEAGLSAVRDAIRTARTAPRTGAPESADDEAVPEGAFVVDVSDSPRESGNRGGAVLTVAERAGSILLELEFDTGSQGDGGAFLDRLRAFFLDPRLALL